MNDAARPRSVALPQRILAVIIALVMFVALVAVTRTTSAVHASANGPAPQERTSEQPAVGPSSSPATTAATHAASSPSSGPYVAVAAAPTPGGRGFWVAWANGMVTTAGDAHFFGDLRNVNLSRPLVGIAPTPSGGGYWLLGGDGGVFSFGDARFYGSTGHLRLRAPALQMSATRDGRGYDFVARDGGIFTFGDARFYGSTGNLRLARPVVGMAAAPGGSGYWLVASDGGIFTFGGVHFYGSTGRLHLAQPVVGMAPTPDGRGYWLVASDGGIFTFGDARFYGSGSGRTGGARAVGAVAGPNGAGYWIVLSDGVVLSEGHVGTVASSARPPAPPRLNTQYHFEVTNAAGSPIRWDPCESINYAVVDAGAPAGWQTDVRNTIGQLAGATHLRVVDAGVYASASSVPSSANLTISWVRTLSSGDEVGLATYWYYLLNRYTPQIVKASVQLLSSLRGGSGNGGEVPVMLHELGHAVGLAHTPNEPEIMNPYDIGMPNYQLGDLNGLYRLGAVAGCGGFYH